MLLVCSDVLSIPALHHHPNFIWLVFFRHTWFLTNHTFWQAASYHWLLDLSYVFAHKHYQFVSQISTQNVT